VTNLSDTFLAYVPYIALLTRAWLGGNMMIHGYSKLRNIKKTVEEMKQGLGIPVTATYISTILEFFSGIFLIIGLFFTMFMIANIIMRKTKMNAVYIALSSKPSYEIDITYLILALSLIVLGAGTLSLDSLIGLT
jgi:uncharacterized membrane protein YphA (DoxX/SURF4 family)